MRSGTRRSAAMACTVAAALFAVLLSATSPVGADHRSSEKPTVNAIPATCGFFADIEIGEDGPDPDSYLYAVRMRGEDDSSWSYTRRSSDGEYYVLSPDSYEIKVAAEWGSHRSGWSDIEPYEVTRGAWTPWNGGLTEASQDNDHVEVEWNDFQPYPCLFGPTYELEHRTAGPYGWGPWVHVDLGYQDQAYRFENEGAINIHEVRIRMVNRHAKSRWATVRVD